MLTYPEFEPAIVSFGPLAIRWYGLMYLIGFAGGWWLGRVRARQPNSGWQPREVDDLVFYIGLGTILGGRLGYTLFYNFPVFLEDPVELLRIWRGGMSFHGGFLGVMAALWLFKRRYRKDYWQVVDFIAPFVPIGLGAGRLGNFINGELWGSFTTLPWGMQLPCDNAAYSQQFCGGATTGLSPPVHPSQLYEFLLEGVALFVILWVFSSRPRPTMAVSGVFALGYGVFRFAVEFVRLPDQHIGYLAFDWLTMGHVLSTPLILVGLILLWLAYGRAQPVVQPQPNRSKK
ncbi:MAG: prolipoprotein diacylglyceryl transferase [Gammaproteobacteria bacterium SG8_47]|nr:MAG: prolipoprotein diacylglyceryl transferase [Gammaproteobacteria bacterium SG8_47]